MVAKKLKDKNNNIIDEITVLNTYYQRNCSLFIPILFIILSAGIFIFIKINTFNFKWFIDLGFIIIFILSTFIAVFSLIKVFEFTKFWEVHISNNVLALPLLESYQVIEQRGDIFTIIKRTEDMSFIDKVKENFIRPNYKLKQEKAKDKRSEKNSVENKI